jgi:hypothetical protein
MILKISELPGNCLCPDAALCAQEEEKLLKPGTIKHMVFTVLKSAEDQVWTGAQTVLHASEQLYCSPLDRVNGEANVESLDCSHKAATASGIMQPRRIRTCVRGALIVPCAGERPDHQHHHQPGQGEGAQGV